MHTQAAGAIKDIIDLSRKESLNILQVKTFHSNSLEDCLTKLCAKSDCPCRFSRCSKAVLKYKLSRCPNVLIFEFDNFRTWEGCFINETFDLSKVFALSRDNSQFSLEAVVSNRGHSIYKHEGAWKNRFTQDPISLWEVVRRLSDCSLLLFYKKMSYVQRFKIYTASSNSN
jgi:hypothetical protein